MIFNMKILLILCGDVETNPGPFPSLPSLPSFDKKDDPVTLLQIVVDEQSKKIRKSFSKTFFSKKKMIFAHLLLFLPVVLLNLSSELKELVETQTEVIVDIQGKLEECGRNLNSTTIDLEKTKNENKKIKEELHNQNNKFQSMYDILQQEDKDIIKGLTKHKVDIDNHQEALKNVMELICEESNKNKNVANNIMNLSKNTEAKIEELKSNIKIEQASLQVKLITILI